MQKICPSILKISEQVLHALSNNKPVVALQSTIISHGMPYPQNRKCALSIEQKIRDQGAVPATVAIFDGKINVGLNEDQIEKLASLGHTGKVRKVSRRDLAFSIANKQSGATTVSGTMIAAHAANIDIFVTGGIGGVHRGFQQTMDVSADLQELARTAVTVVSAGVKSILDIPRTLQYLQTKGVPVITYKSNYFPAFFSESSGIASPFTVSSQLQMAKIIYSHQQLGLESGMLLGVPNPRPAQGKLIQSAIERAIKQSRQQKVTGAKITPFLLKRVVELTEGKSLQSNISLVHNNAEVGGRVASELAKIRAEAKQRATKAFSLYSAKGCNTQKNKNQNKIKDQDQEKSKWRQKPKGRIVAIGGSAIDYQLSPRQGKFQLNKSCIGRTRKSLGGIARNIVDCASKLEIKTTLVTAMGRDSQGNTISEFCNKHNIQLLSILPQKANTQNEQTSSGRYYAIMDHNNNELLGISEMQINELLTFNNVFDCFLKKQAEVPQSDPNRLGPNDIVIVDSNIPDKQLLKIVQFVAEQFGCMIVYESKGQKAKRVVTGNAIPYINLLKMNYHEKLEIAKALEYDTEQIKLDSYLAKNIGHNHPNNEMFKIKAIITKGSESIQLLRGLERQCTSQLLEVPKIQKIEKTTGAGDTFTGTFCSMLLWGKSQTEALLFGQAGSKINIESPVTQSVITQKLSRKYLEQQVIKMKKQK